MNENNIESIVAENIQLKTDLEATDKELERLAAMLDIISMLFESSHGLKKMLDQIEDICEIDRLGKIAVILAEIIGTSKQVMSGKIQTAPHALQTFSEQLKHVGIDIKLQEFKNEDEFEQMKALAEAQNQGNTHH